MRMLMSLGAMILLSFGVSQVGARMGHRPTTLTASTFDDFVQKNQRLVIDFYDPEDSDYNNHQKELEAALVKVRRMSSSEVSFATVDCKKEEELAKKYIKNGRYPQLLWFVNGKPTRYHRTLRTSRAITDFVMALDRPYVAQVSSEQGAFDYNRAVLARISKKSKAFHALEVVASRHMDTVAFVYLESNDNVIEWVEGDKQRRTYTGDQQDEEALDKWMKEQLPLKSEPIPSEEDSMDGGSMIVVGKNFEDKVCQAEKDVMLLVYAPWCGYCKKMLPEWERMTTALANVKHLQVAKMDGDRNDSPMPEDFSWDAYPTIFYVKAGQKFPIIYRGNRTLEHLISFVKEHTSKPIGESVSDSIADL